MPVVIIIKEKLLDWLSYLLSLGFSWLFFLVILCFFWIKKDKGLTGALNE